MSLLRIEYWGVYLDVIVVLACLATIWMLVRHRRQADRKDEGSGSARSPMVVEDPLLQRLLIQQSEKSFAMMLELLKKNPQAFRDVEAPLHPATAATTHAGHHVAPVTRVAIEPEPLDEADGNADHRIAELADQGMTSRQISELLKIPSGEIELILKLKQGFPTPAMTSPNRFRRGLRPARS